MSTIHLLMGVPGSGKSTLSKKLQFKFGGEIVSSDIIRERLISEGILTKENCQEPESNKLVFSGVHARIAECAQSGIDVYFDATNLEKLYRKTVFDIAAKTGCPVVGHLLLLPREECIARINKRQEGGNADHFIDDPAFVVDKYLAFLATQAPTLDEGFSKLKTYKNNKLTKIESSIANQPGNN